MAASHWGRISTPRLVACGCWQSLWNWLLMIVHAGLKTVSDPKVSPGTSWLQELLGEADHTVLHWKPHCDCCGCKQMATVTFSLYGRVFVCRHLQTFASDQSDHTEVCGATPSSISFTQQQSAAAPQSSITSLVTRHFESATNYLWVADMYVRVVKYMYKDSETVVMFAECVFKV